MNPLVNNWTYGETSAKLGGRFDLPVYAQGCELLRNFRPMLQGGITRRPPLVHIAETEDSRLIDFSLGGTQSFLIQLAPYKVFIWQYDTAGVHRLSFVVNGQLQDHLVSPYGPSEIWEVQYAQYYDRLYLVHRSHSQQVLYYSSGAFSLETFALQVDMDESLGRQVDSYPSVVAVCANRLWYAATNARPFTVWASRPYRDTTSHSDFTTYDVVLTETEVLKDPALWPTKIDGDGQEVFDLSDPQQLITISEETNEIITATCAMKLELASGRNDRIVWIRSMRNILIGTEASEWMVPFEIDPTKQAASMLSSYGSESLQAVSMHNGVFYLQHGRRLRENLFEGDASDSVDLSFTCDHLLGQGVRQMVAKRSGDPMIACVLTDGTLAVLTYDRRYAMQGWARWDTQGQILSLSTFECPEGQHLYAVVKRARGTCLERFDFDETLLFYDRPHAVDDGDLPYASVMVGNRFDIASDSGTTIGRSKKVREVWVRCLDSGRVATGVESKSMQRSLKAVGSEDHRINIAGGAKKEIRLRIESVESDPLTLLAMTFDMEVN